MIESEVPLAFVTVVTLISLVGAGLMGIVLQALNSMTSSRVRQATEEGQAGPYLAKVYGRRPAALAAVSAVRDIFIILATLGIFTVIATVVHNGWLVWLVTLVLTVILLIVVGRIFPVDLGFKHPVRALRLAGRYIWPLTRFGSLFVKNRESDDEEERENMHEDALKVMVERISESEVVEDDERSMLHSVFELSHTIVREVMVPRTDMVTIDAQETLDSALSVFTRSGFSRIPVIGASPDDLLGVLYLKDVVRRLHHRSDTEGLLLSDVMREAQFVPEFMLADDLLEFMQTQQNHIAFAVDEYGGIAGLVTIEDLLEELVGELVDEHDRQLPEVEELADGIYRVPARMPIDDVGELFGIDFDDDDVDTIGGLLTKGLGRIPIQGSQTEVAGLKLSADHFEGRRKRLVTVIAQRAEASDDNND